MNTIFEDLKKYFATTPQDKILKDWEATKIDDEIGPTVQEFLCYTDFFFNISNSTEVRPNEKITINHTDPKYTSGFLLA